MRTALLLLVLTVPAAVSQVKIDIKTPSGEKEQLKIAKAGLNAYLRQSDWAKVVNADEDYSVILRNWKRKLSGNVMTFELDLELRTGSLLGGGKLIAAKHLSDSVDLAEAGSLRTFEAREMFHHVSERLSANNKFKAAVNAIGSATQIPGVGAVIEKGLGYFGVELEGSYRADQAVEGMVMGAILMTELKPMISALPPPTDD